jgi:hypothetical protein
MEKSFHYRCYISIDNDKKIGNQLYKLAYLINILKSKNNKYIKRKIVFNKDNNLYHKSLFKGLFNILDNNKYNNIPFHKIDIDDINNINDIDIINYVEPLNIEINHDNRTSNKISNIYTYINIDENIRNKIIELVYSNEDLMYSAYYKYRDMLNYFGNNTTDDEVAIVHILKDDDVDYYNNALSIMKDGHKITNIAVMTDDINWAKIILDDINSTNDYNFYYISDKGKYSYEINFILMSMFKNTIITNNLEYCTDSLWSSFISFYHDKKIIASSNILGIHKYITDIV